MANSVCQKEGRMGTSPRVWLFTLLALSLLLLEPPRARASVGSGSCFSGIDPCDGNTGDIGTDSCNGDQACEDNSGKIDNHSCNAGVFEADACEGNSGPIGTSSCDGDFACFGNSGKIGNNACNAESACFFNTG